MLRHNERTHLREIKEKESKIWVYTRANCRKSSGTHFDESVFPILRRNTPVVHCAWYVAKRHSIFQEAVFSDRERTLFREGYEQKLTTSQRQKVVTCDCQSIVMNAAWNLKIWDPYVQGKIDQGIWSKIFPEWTDQKVL